MIKPKHRQAQVQGLVARIKQQAGLQRNAVQAFNKQRKQRVLAGKQDIDPNYPIFLRPDDIEIGLNYDMEKVYRTTLNGELRYLTLDDFKAIKENIGVLQNRFKKGITAKKVINLSLPIDVERCNRQIHTATPYSIKDGTVEFVVNASGETPNRTHYHVQVKFLSYNNAVLAPQTFTREEIKRNVVLKGIKFQCQCERHTFYYRYMATLGGYNLGRSEDAYPKIRNPNLSGVACKHVLRVMQSIQQAPFISYLERNLKKERGTGQMGTRITQSKSQVISQVQKSTQQPIKSIKQNPKALERELNNRAKERSRQFFTQERKKYAKENKLSESDAKKALKQNALNQLEKLKADGVISKEIYQVYKKGLNK